MQLVASLLAVSSVLLFEAVRRLLATRATGSGLVLLSCAVASLTAAWYLEASQHKLFSGLTQPFSVTTFKNGPPWNDPRLALAELPQAERAEKSRVLAGAYYAETGRLIQHLSPEGAVVLFVPTQQEIEVRESALALRSALESKASAFADVPAHLLLAPAAAAAFALALFWRRRNDA